MGAGAELADVSRTQLLVLAGGTTLGVVVLTFSQLPSVLRLGLRWQPTLGWSDPSVRGAIKAGTYGMAFFAVTTVGLLVTLGLANRVAGGVVAYRVAYAFFELPKALIGLPIAVALLPALSERWGARDEDSFGRLVSNGWRAAMFAAAPAGAGLFVLAPSISAAMLGQAPTGAAPALVSAALRGLALGIPAFVLVEPMARAFYARRDTRSPVLWTGVGLIAFGALVVPLTIALRPDGGRALQVIGGATSAGQWVAVAVGVVMLAATLRGWPVRSDMASAAGSVVRATVMAAVVWLVVRPLAAYPVIASVVGIVCGAGVYLALSARSGELRRTLTLLREAHV
jgi:putative peptidoglycan lipid II flippase